MGQILLFSVVLLFIVLVAIGAHQKENKRRSDLKARLAQYEPEELYWSTDYRSAFGISRKRQSIVLLSKGFVGEYNFSRIASVEILRDGVTITNSNRGSQLAGAMVGGLAFGGIGALAGALSGSSRSIGNTTNLELKFIVDCISSPVYVVNFFSTSSKRGVSQKDPVLKSAVERLDRCHAMVVNAMRNHQLSVSHQTLAQPALSSSSQLQQLWELRQVGALTEEEFHVAKRRLME